MKTSIKSVERCLVGPRCTAITIEWDWECTTCELNVIEARWTEIITYCCSSAVPLMQFHWSYVYVILWIEIRHWFDTICRWINQLAVSNETMETIFLDSLLSPKKLISSVSYFISECRFLNIRMLFAYSWLPLKKTFTCFSRKQQELKPHSFVNFSWLK